MEIPEKIRRQVKVAHALADLDASRGLRGYLEHVVIDSRPEPRRFAEVARGWQWDRVGRLEAALEAVAGLRPPLPPESPRCFAEIMPRGHDKTTGLARFVNWLLGYSSRKLEVVSASGDWDQAALLIESMKAEADLNPWMRRLTVRSRHAYGPGGHMKVLTADAPTSMGKKVDVFIIDELTWWKKPDLWNTLWSGWQKMPGAVMFVISNAGVQGSWQHKDFYLTYRHNPRWVFYEAPGQLDTWMSPEDIALVREGLPRGFARRVLDNVWIDPAEDGGYLTREEVAACEELGRQLGLSYMTQGRPGVEYLLSIDYGPKRDRTALAVLHQEPDGPIRLDRLDVWQGSPEEPIRIDRVREWVDEQRKAFNCSWMVLDPHELLELAQDYENVMEVEQWEAHGGKSNYTMAEALRTQVVNRRIAWYPGAGTLVLPHGGVETLLDEIPRLVIVPTPYGYRFDHTARFHDDRAVVLGMGVVTLLRGRRYHQFKAPPAIKPPDPEVFRLRKSAPRELFGLR